MPHVSISIEMDEETKARLDTEARIEDRPAADVALAAINDFLNRKSSLRVAIQEAQAMAANGEFISGEAMHAWIESWDSGNELPVPDIDIRRPVLSRK